MAEGGGIPLSRPSGGQSRSKVQREVSCGVRLSTGDHERCVLCALALCVFGFACADLWERKVPVSVCC